MTNVWQQFQTPAEGEESEGEYEDMTKAELEALLVARDLPKSGTKDELIARLEEYDG